MTSLSENKQENEVNIDSKQCIMENEQSLLHNNNNSESIPTVTQPSIDNDQKQEKTDEMKQNNDSIINIEEKNVLNEINNDDALMNTSPPIVTIDEEPQKEATQSTVNNHGDENRTKKSFYSKVKYTSMPYHRSSYYTNGHSYGPPPYYYYSLPSIEKPPPLMFISPPQPSPSSSSSSPSSRDTTAVSPQNLPPRLRQPSTTETESNSQVIPTTPTTPQSSSSTTTTTTTNNRRHRSTLPRGAANYYPTHLPPPLMATPPGVLYPYPSTVHHQPGHIAYNIRTVDELELYALQQQLMHLPPTPIIWSSPHGHHHFPPYAMNGLPPAYVFKNAPMAPSMSSFLNPEAAEWVPVHHDNELPPSDNNILIDDEINFPPLNSTINNTQTTTNVKDHIEENCEQIETSSDINLPNDNNTNDNPSISTDNSNISIQSNPKIPSSSSSSQDDNNNNNKSLSSSPIKITPLTYSTVTSQTSDTNKLNKNHQLRQEQPITNHVHNQLPPRDRTMKQRTQNVSSSSSSSNFNSRRHQPFTNNPIMIRNLLPTETNAFAKQQSPVIDDWIEVKSKKTKKFDRNLNDNSTEKFLIDEQIHKSVSPALSLTSTGDNTTATFTSEDDFDEKDTQDLVVIMDNHVANDYNQIIVDDIHNRLDNNERLLIIIRGCPGSGKSTLAKSLNHGYNGVILSTDDYFIDHNLNKYVFDLNQLDDAHRYNRRRASDAFKRNLTPIIIDNTNTQIWEMKPYVAMGKEAGYDMLLIEPQTPWRYKARELFNRNRHNLPIRRIREMLNRFEHDITIHNIIDQLPSTTKPTNSTSSEQETFDKDTEIIDSILTSKKFYNIIDDSLILDDVRLCINDMILFLTSNFYQTTLLSSILTLPTPTTTTTSPTSTPLSVSFHDLSLISSSPTTPSTPSTPHSRFHRPLTRFSSTTNQDHSLNTEHILRLPTATTFSRGIDTINLTPPLSAQSSMIAKKRRKNKNKQQSNELILNTNNNNNNNYSICEEENFVQQQQLFNVFLPEDCLDFVVIDEQNNDNHTKMNSSGDQALTIPDKQNQFQNNELNKSSLNPSISTQHIAIQCSSDNLNSNSLDFILIDHSSSIPSLSGSNQIGIQTNIPTLHQLSLNILKQWNEQIQSRNSSIDDEILIDLTLNNPSVKFIDSNQINIPWSIINLLEEIYGEIPNKSLLLSNNNGVLLPIDHDLSINIYQSLQRFLRKSNPVKNNKDRLFQQIIHEEQRTAEYEKIRQNHQIDYPIEHKLKELQHHFPTIDIDRLHDIFRENEYNYDITFTRISSMLNDKHKSSLKSRSRSISTMQTIVEPVLESYKNLRHDAHCHAQQRKEFYIKAQHVNHYGMSGVTSFYIHRAREETELMKHADRAACEHLSQWKLIQFYRTQQLDLHDLHSDEALNLFKQIEKEHNQRTTQKSIEILTADEKIRSVILTYLQQRNYTYSDANKDVILMQLTNAQN